MKKTTIISRGTRFVKKDRDKMLSSNSPFLIKEAYNLARTKLIFAANGEKCPVFAVTSADASEGKTINTINLATSFAMMGKKTLIIDSDMRNPSIHKYFNVPRKNGLSEVLAKLETTVSLKQSETENLYFITSGEIPPNPSEIMSGDTMHELIDYLKERFDFIFIDTPPVSIVTDATLLSNFITGYLLVVRDLSTDIQLLQKTVDTLKEFDGRVCGFVLNDTDGKSNTYKSSYYNYRYRYKYYYNYNYQYGSSKNSSK